MGYHLRPFLINGRFGDPGLYVGFEYEKRALLLDIGDVSALSPSQLRVVSDLFVSHAHLDHFSGFDQLFRHQLDLSNELRIYGPAGITEKIGHKLAAYSWNLDVPQTTALSIVVTEIASRGSARKTRLDLKDKFKPGKTVEQPLRDGRILEDHDILVDCVLLDHKLPCLAFAIRERNAFHIDEDKLAAQGLPHGPWLFRLQQALKQDLPLDTLITIDQTLGKRALGDLRNTVTSESPGWKICYVTDCQFNDENATRIVELAQDADALFIEATFIAADEALAHARYHLTTTQAGLLAAKAGAKSITPFHFSRRYRDREKQMLEEVESAFDRNLDRRNQTHRTQKTDPGADSVQTKEPK